MTDPRAAIRANLARIATLVDETGVLVDQLPDPVVAPPADPPPGGVSLQVTPLTVSGEQRLRCDWLTDRKDVAGWTVGRSGADTTGGGAWASPILAGSARSFTFNNLVASTPYTVTLRPVLIVGSVGSVTPVSGSVTTLAAPVVVPPVGGSGATASERLEWGPPSWRDDFSGATLDLSKWELPPKDGWPGHDRNGRRDPRNVFIRDGAMVLQGDAGGSSAWVKQKLPTRYGRWEFRLSSRNTGDKGAPYHVLALLWPTAQPGPEGVKEYWPRDSELDLVEVTDPDARKAAAWLHYPTPSLPVQQAGPFETPCEMNKPHWFSAQWDSTGVRAWIDGAEWYGVAGGATATRGPIQGMPEGTLRFQLDNFTGNGGLRPAEMVIEEVRFWKI